MVLVGIPVAFQESAEIKQGLRQATTLAEHPGDEQTADAPVAVHKRVDRFELIMGQGELDKDGKIARVMEELLEIPEQGAQRRRRGWHKTRFVQGLPLTPDHDLAIPKRARPFRAAAHPFQQAFVDFAQEAEADGQVRQPLQSVLQRPDLVGDFGNVGVFRLVFGLEFKKEQLLQSRDRAFDAAGEDGFAPQEWADQQMGIGQHPANAGQFAQGMIRLGKLLDQGGIKRQRRRQRVRFERPVPGGVSHQLPRSVFFEIVRTQVENPFGITAYSTKVELLARLFYFFSIK